MEDVPGAMHSITPELHHFIQIIRLKVCRIFFFLGNMVCSLCGSNMTKRKKESKVDAALH